MLQRHPSTVPHLRTQKLRPLAVTTARRSAALPDVPTVAEAGHAAAEATSWTALVVPAGTPRATISRLHKEAVKALSLPDVRATKFDGAEPVGSTPDEFAFYLKQSSSNGATSSNAPEPAQINTDKIDRIYRMRSMRAGARAITIRRQLTQVFLP